MRQPQNILEQILFGLEAVNANVVELSAEIVELRRDCEVFRRSLAPMPELAGADDGGVNQPGDCKTEEICQAATGQV